MTQEEMIAMQMQKVSNDKRNREEFEKQNEKPRAAINAIRERQRRNMIMGGSTPIMDD